MYISQIFARTPLASHHALVASAWHPMLYRKLQALHWTSDTRKLFST